MGLTPTSTLAPTRTHPAQDLAGTLLDSGCANEAADAYVAERAAWLAPRPASGMADARGRILLGFGDAFLPELDSVCGASGERLRANPQRARKELIALSRKPSVAAMRHAWNCNDGCNQRGKTCYDPQVRHET